MNYFEGFLLVVHVGVALAICAFVLLQHGKGADMGAAFGSGSSGSLFGSAGSANFLSHTTAVLAAVFFITSIGLTWYAASHGKPGGLMERSVLDKNPPATTPAGAPAAPAGGASPAPAPDGSKAGEVPK